MLKLHSEFMKLALVIWNFSKEISSFHQNLGFYGNDLPHKICIFPDDITWHLKRNECFWKLRFSAFQNTSYFWILVQSYQRNQWFNLSKKFPISLYVEIEVKDSIFNVITVEYKTQNAIFSKLRKNFYFQSPLGWISRKYLQKNFLQTYRKCKLCPG